MGKHRNIHSIGDLVSQLISRRGYAQIAATDEFHAIIAGVVGSHLAEQFAVGKLNRGKLRIYAGDSVTIQELTFFKTAILKKIQAELPQSKVTDLRFSVQPMDGSTGQ